MLGLRVIGLPLNKELRFNLESSHISTECSSFVQLPYSLNFTRVDVERLSRRFSFNFSATAAAGLMPSTIIHRDYPNNIRTFFLDTNLRPSPDRWKAYLGWGPLPTAEADPQAVGQPRRLVFGSIKALDNGRRHAISLTNCSVLELCVESAVYCPGHGASRRGGCRVEQMRRSLIDMRPPTVTLFDHPVLVASIPPSLATASNGAVDLAPGAEHFLQWGNYHQRLLYMPDKNLSSLSNDVDVTLVRPRIFSRHLSILLNTFYQCIISMNDDSP